MYYKYFMIKDQIHIVECESMIENFMIGERKINGILIKDSKDLTINKTFRSSSTWNNLFPTSVDVPAKHVILAERNDERAKSPLKEYYLQKQSNSRKSIDKIDSILISLS